MHGGIRILLHLNLFFACCISHSYLPSAFIDTEFVPLLKNKTGDIVDASNYRAIAISNAESKLLENVILQRIQSSRDDVSCYQLGFKKGNSTGLCTYMLKQTVEYYTLGGSHVFLCCVDFSKAFDKVNYWKLFRMLLNDSLDFYRIKLLVFWYSNQMACVRWRNSTSSAFHIGNGIKQGGVLSPYMFTYYVYVI